MTAPTTHGARTVFSTDRASLNSVASIAAIAAGPALVNAIRSFWGRLRAGTSVMNKTRRTQLTAPAPASTKSAVTIALLCAEKL
jgi:hypothetical protein